MKTLDETCVDWSVEGDGDALMYSTLLSENTLLLMVYFTSLIPGINTPSPLSLIISNVFVSLSDPLPGHRSLAFTHSGI